MAYQAYSEWNEENEIRCLLIFKKLVAESFPRGRQMSYCRAMARETNLSAENISAKVSNFKSVAGVNNPSNASSNTKRIYEAYGHLGISELENVIKSGGIKK